MRVSRDVLFGISSLCLVSALSPLPVAAQSAPGDRRTALIIYTENDDWPPDTGTDKNYTNGLRFTLDRNYDMFGVRRLAKVPMFWWLGGDDCSATNDTKKKCLSTAFHFGQQFYTPDNIALTELQPLDRPYAGWLYIGGSARASNIKQMTNLDVYVGFTGAPSLARQVQTKWHEIVGATRPEGWDHQIDSRFGVIASVQQRWATDLTRTPPDGGEPNRWFEVMGGFSGSVGNILTDGGAQGRVKIGYNISRDWAHNAITPVRRAADSRTPQEPAVTDTPVRPFEIYLALDAQGRAVGYNAFLDLADDHLLDRRHFVGEGGIALGVRIKAFSFSYRVALTTREYDPAPHHHEFKSFRIVWRM